MEWGNWVLALGLELKLGRGSVGNISPHSPFLNIIRIFFENRLFF